MILLLAQDWFKPVVCCSILFFADMRHAFLWLLLCLLPFLCEGPKPNNPPLGDKFNLEDELLFLVCEGQTSFTRIHRIANKIKDKCTDIPKCVQEIATLSSDNVDRAMHRSG